MAALKVDFNDGRVFCNMNNHFRNHSSMAYEQNGSRSRFGLFNRYLLKEMALFEYCPGTLGEGHYRAGFHSLTRLGDRDYSHMICMNFYFIRNPVFSWMKAWGFWYLIRWDSSRRGSFEPGSRRLAMWQRGYSLKNYDVIVDKPLNAGWWLKSFWI